MILLVNKIQTCVMIVVAGAFFLMGNCKNSDGVEPIPTAPVNITIDLNLISYQHMNLPGNIVFLEGGVKGIALIHDFDGQWYAFERTCGFQPLSPCNKIWYDTNTIQLRCGQYDANNRFSNCCETKYLMNGLPTAGPGRQRLARYRVGRNSNLVYINN